MWKTRLLIPVLAAACLAALFLAFMGPTLADTQIDPELVYERIEQGIAEGSYAEVIGTLEEMLAIEPDDGRARFLLGVAYSRTQRLREAESSLRAALGLPGSRPGSTRYQLGGVLWGLARFDEAAAEFRRAAELLDDPTEAFDALGRVLLETGETDGARAAFESALARRPDHASANYRLGLIDYRAGRVEPALARFDAALAADPGLLEAEYQRGLALVRLGRREEGAAQLDAYRVALAAERARRREGKDREAALSMAREAAEIMAAAKPARAELDRALALLRRARELAPTWTELELRLAEVHEARGEGEEAERARERYRGLSESNPQGRKE